MPPVNKWGAHFGYIIGMALSTWVYIGSKQYPPNAEQTRILDRWTYRY